MDLANLNSKEFKEFQSQNDEEFDQSMLFIINYYKGNLTLVDLGDMEKFVIGVIERFNPDIVREFKLIALDIDI